MAMRSVRKSYATLADFKGLFLSDIRNSNPNLFDSRPKSATSCFVCGLRVAAICIGVIFRRLVYSDGEYDLFWKLLETCMQRRLQNAFIGPVLRLIAVSPLGGFCAQRLPTLRGVSISWHDRQPSWWLSSWTRRLSFKTCRLSDGSGGSRGRGGTHTLATERSHLNDLLEWIADEDKMNEWW